MSLTEELLNNIIKKELLNIERDGTKIKLKTVLKKKIEYTIICAVVIAATIALNIWILSPAVIVAYFLLLHNTTNVKIIAQLAKKSPDKPICDIIREDMK